MIEDIIDSNNPLLGRLGNLGETAWVNQFYDLVDRILKDLKIGYNDQRISLSVTKEGKLPVIFGQRYILEPLKNQRIKCIVPADFVLNELEGVDSSWYFSPDSTRDAKWIEVPFAIGFNLPSRLYNAILIVCKSILKKHTKSGFRKFHSELLFEFITQPEVRSDILKILVSKELSKPPKTIASPNSQKSKCILLTWNPERWEWKDFEKNLKEVHEQGSTTMRWSCGNSKNIKVDDQVYLIRLGPKFPGIIGSGFVITSPFKDKHFAVEDQKALYIEVVFDSLLNYGANILRLDVLKKEMPEQLWTPQASGISIKYEYLSKLEELWVEYKNCIPEQPSENYDQPETEQTFLEGKAYSVLQTRYERDAQARLACLSKKGFSCTVCSFDFQKVYGELGAGFIHVHHIKMVKDMGRPTETNPEFDLEPVCPNCHAMLHKRYPPYSIEELQFVMNKNMKNG